MNRTTNVIKSGPLQIEEQKFNDQDQSNLISIKSRGTLPSGNTKFNTKLNKLLTNVSIKDSRAAKSKPLGNIPERS